MSVPKKRRAWEPRAGAALQVGAEDSAPSGLFDPQVSAPPADLVTSERLKGVRFDLAQPRGYFTEQVDTLVKLLISSLAWHEEALYQRDQGIHVLQTDLDATAEQEATLRAQVEVFRVQGSVTIGDDGQIVRKSQVSAANDALAEARGATASAEQRLTVSIEEVRSLREWADIVIPQTTQVAELARVAQEQLEQTVQELAADREKSAAMTAHVASLEYQVASLQSQVTSLQSRQPGVSTAAGGMAPPIANNPEDVAVLAVPEATSAEPVAIQDTVPANPMPAYATRPNPMPAYATRANPTPYVAPADPTPYAAPADPTPVYVAPAGSRPAGRRAADTIPAGRRAADRRAADRGPVDNGPVGTFEQTASPAAHRDPAQGQLANASEGNLDDPELPAGITLPRAQYDREYISAHPGDPLMVGRRSPLTVWAPELSAHQDATPAAEPSGRAPVADDGWGAPLEVPVDVNPPPVPIQHGEAAPTDVSDGVARPQLRRQV